MKRLFCALLLCASFVSYAAEKQTSSLGGVRKINLGNTGAEPRRKTSVEHAMQSANRWQANFLNSENLTMTSNGSFAPRANGNQAPKN